MGLEIIEILLIFEEEFRIKIPDEAIQPMETAGDLYELVVTQIRKQHPDRFDANDSYGDQVWQTIKWTLHEVVGTDLDVIRMESRLDKDIGIMS